MAEENAGDRSAPGAGSPDLKIDTSVAHPARVYDYWLGGKDNFAADREAAEQALQAYPQLGQAVQANRKFLARAVRYLTGEVGIRQFLDVGTGIPAADNTHQVAQREAPQSRSNRESSSMNKAIPWMARSSAELPTSCTSSPTGRSTSSPTGRRI